MLRNVWWSWPCSTQSCAASPAAGGCCSRAATSVSTSESVGPCAAPIEWTPHVAFGAADANYPATVATVQQDNTLETRFVDFIAGGKIRFADQIFLTAAITVPLNDAGLRPTASGTLGVDVLF